MRRRDFLTLATAAAAWPLAARGQAKVPRIAVVGLALVAERVEALRQGLADHGNIDGRTITVDYFLAPTSADLPAYAAMAVASKPDVIVCTTTPATLAAKAATSTIPIVMVNLNDPVGNGLVASLTQPGGNITGNTGTGPDLVGKQLGLFKELVPALRRLAVLTNPADPSNALIVAQLRLAAQALNIEPVVFEFDETRDFSAQLERVATANVQGFFVVGSAYVQNNTDASFRFQLRTKIPRMNGQVAIPPYTGVIYYGGNTLANYRQIGEYVDQILKGAKPADLPVQQPKVFELAINTATAKSIGLTIPASIFAQATIVDDRDYSAVRP